jgi:hypothetical protein
VCQICNRVGHVASKCYNRFDHSYQYEALNPSSFLTTQHSQPDLSWYPDIGSTNHLTNNLFNLKIRVDECHGIDQIKVRNGQGLDILHTCLAQLSTPHRTFSLPNLLHVPHIEKNLISVYQFTHDNKVFIEFHPSFFCVKVLYSGRLLLHAPNRVGLYPWPSTSPPQSVRTALIGEQVSIDQWHNCLGHPATPVVHRVLSFCPSIVSLCCLTNLLHFVLPVSKEKCTNFILVFLYLSQKILWIFFILMYGALLLFYLLIINATFCALWIFRKYFWLFPLSLKSDVLNVFTQFKAMVEFFF